MKIKKVDKLVANLHDKTECVIHKRNLKEALNNGLVLKKVHRLIKFNQNAWLKRYIDMNSDLIKKAKNGLKKDSFKLMNNVVFGKTMENVRKHRCIKLVTRERRRNYLVSEPYYKVFLGKLSYYKVFHGNFISNRNEKKKKNRDTYE